MTARQITEHILALAEAYRGQGSAACEEPSAFAARRLSERRAGESKRARLEPDVVSFIGLLLDGFIRHFAVSEALFEGYCDGMRRSTEDRYGMAFMAYLVLFRYNTVDFGADTLGPLIFHVSARTRIVEFVEFMCDADMLSTHAAARWVKHVQDAYVEDFLIPTCLENAAALRMAILTPTERGEAPGFGRSAVGGGGSGRTSPTFGMGGSTMMELLHNSNDSSDEEDGDGVGGKRTASAKALTKGGSANAKAKGVTPLRLNSTAKPSASGTTPRGGGAPHFASPRPPRTPLPPAGVRDMQYTVPEAKPKPIGAHYKATEAELRAVAAARHGVKLSALDDATRAENRAREEAIPFRPFAITERPSNAERLLEEQLAREREAMAPLPPRPTVEEVRRNLKEVSAGVEVKTTKAALTRELALIKKKRDEEEAKYAHRLAALRDDTEFREWQAQGRQADDEERLRLAHQRRLDAMIADEEARLTRDRQTRARQAESKVMRTAIEGQRGALRRENEARQAELRAQAEEQRAQLGEAVAEAVGAVQSTRKAHAEEAKAQRQRNEVEMALAAELERQRKAEMILCIRQMREESAEMRREAVLAKQAANKAAAYASTTEDGLALQHVPMEDMTLVDLKKLLHATTRERARLVEEKRVRIASERAAEKAAVGQMEAVVAQHREAVRAEKEAKREEGRVKLSAAAAAAKAKEEQQIVDLQARLAQRREERKTNAIAVRDDERRRAVAAQLLMRDSKAVERHKHAQMERAAEGTVIAAQNARLRERRVGREISANEAAKRDDNLNSAQRRLQEARALSDQINAEKKGARREEDAFDLLVRKALYAEMGGSSASSARR